MNSQRDSKLDILIDISLDNLITLAKKYVTDDNGRPYNVTDIDILNHVKKECDILSKKLQLGIMSRAK